MTLINTGEESFKKYNKTYFTEKFTIYLFSLLPISLILGNSAINLNILIIDIFFLFICFRQKKWSWIKNKYFYLFVSIWIYLLLNSIFAPDITINFIVAFEQAPYSTFEPGFSQKDSILRSLGYGRFIVFLYAFQYFLINSKKVLNHIFLYWSIIIIIVLIDVLFERILGHNLLNFKSPSPQRIVSFFKDELVVGGFLLGFSFLTLGFLFNSIHYSVKKKILSNIFFILTIICIFFSGERSNFIKALIVTSIIIFMMNDSYLYIAKKYILLLIIVGITLPTLLSKDIYNRQAQFFKRIELYDHRSINKKFGHIKHFVHYDTAWKIFKDYPIFGSGNLKFRYICHDKKYSNTDIILTNLRCSNHPHQIHLEILAEQGIVGYLIIIFTIFYVLLNSVKVYLKNKKNNFIHLSSILFILTFFIPLLPSGSFFSTFNATMFWINFSFVYLFLNKPNK